MKLVRVPIGIVFLVVAHVAGEERVFPLHEALKAREYDRALEALQLTTNMDLRDGSGNTALCLAAKNGSADAYDMAIALLRYGADPNVADGKGQSPLHYAAKVGNLAVVEALVRFGSKLNPEYRPLGISENEPGWTPLYYARIKNRTRVVNFLEKRGGKVHDSQDKYLDYHQRVKDLLDEAKKSSHDVTFEDYNHMSNRDRLAYAYSKAINASIRAGRDVGIDSDKILYLEALKHQIESRISGEIPPNITEDKWIDQIYLEADKAATAAVQRK